MKDDFFVSVSDGNGGEQVILIWVPLAILAHNVVLENGGYQKVGHKASLAVIQHGKEIDYDQNLSVRRQVIMAARKAADAVIEELGNGDVAAAVLEAVREGGDLLASAKASGITVDALETSSPETEPAAGGDNTSSNLINVTLSKPMGIIFEPIGDPQECGVRILDLPRGGKAYLSQELKVGDELFSINDTKMSSMTYYEVVNFISSKHDQNQFNLIFQRPRKRAFFSNLMKRSTSKKGNQQVEQIGDRAHSPVMNEMSSPTMVNTSPINRSDYWQGNQLAEQKGDRAHSPVMKPIPVKRSASRKGNQLAEQRDEGAPSRDMKPLPVKRSTSKKGNQLAEQRDDSAPSRDMKPLPVKRSTSRKGNQHAEQRDEGGAPSRDMKPLPVKRSTSKKGNQLAEQRDDSAPSCDMKPLPVRRSTSRKGNQHAEQRDDSAPSREVKPKSVKRSTSRKGNQHAEQRGDRAHSPVMKPLPVKGSTSRKGNQQSEHIDHRVPSREVNESPVPAPTYHKTKKSNTPRMPEQRIDAQSIDTYDSLLSESSQFSFFGLWPTTSRHVRPDTSGTTSKQAYHPSRLIPSWNYSSVASATTYTDESSHAFSQALKEFDLSTLLGAFTDLGGQYSVREDQSSRDNQSSVREDQSSRDDQSSRYDQSSRFGSVSWASSIEGFSSWADDYFSAASSYFDDYSEDDVSTVMSNQPSKSKLLQLNPMKKFRRRRFEM
eukprot:scaffold16406_cov115-Skeletonema_dohrnii-CCMP3373.AAC.4